MGQSGIRPLTHSVTVSPSHALRGLSPREMICALLIVALVRFGCLALYPLTDTTEARYGSIALQMTVTGDWIVPHISPGEPFLGKPPLSFWMSAIGIELFGVNAFAARFGPFLAAALTVALTILLGTRLWGRAAGLLAGLVLATLGLFHVSAGMVMTDPALAASLALSMVALPMSVTSTSHTARRLWGHGLFVGLGLGLLAKGPVALVLAGLSLTLWGAWRRPWAELRSLPWITGPVLMLAIAAPWHILTEMRSPGFLDSYLVGEHIRRFLEPAWESPYGDAHEHPRGVIWLYWLTGAMPWGLIALFTLPFPAHRAATRSALRAEPWLSYLLGWALAPALFFTISRNIMLTYVLPSAAPVALLATRALAGPARAPAWWQRPAAVRVTAALAPLLFLGVCLAVMPRVAHRKSHRDLIDRCQTLSGGAPAHLVYIDDLPFSASFYGQAAGVQFFEEQSDPAFLELLRGPDSLFVVIKDNDEDELEPALAACLAPVARFPSHVLFERVTPARAAPPPAPSASR